MWPLREIYAIFLLCVVAPEFRAMPNITATDKDDTSKYLELPPQSPTFNETGRYEEGNVPLNVESFRNESTYVSKVEGLSLTPVYPFKSNTASTSNDQNTTHESFSQQYLEEPSKDLLHETLSDFLIYEKQRQELVLANRSVNNVAEISVSPDYHIKANTFSTSNEENSTHGNFSQQHLEEEPIKESPHESLSDFLKHEKHRHKLVVANRYVSNVEEISVSPDYHIQANTHFSTSNEQNSTHENFSQQQLKEEPLKESSHESLSDFLMHEKHRHKLVLANRKLKYEIPLISRSRNIVNFSSEYEDKPSISLDAYERAFTDEVVNSPSPCLNGGTFVVINGNYICLCGPDYSGVTCEIHTAVCRQPIKPNDSLPCVTHDKSCRPVPGGGFVCESDLVSSRNATYHNTSNLVECVEESLCPENWQCFNVNQTTDNYRCEPPRTELLYPDFQGVEQNTRSRRSTGDDSCKDNLCQHGAKCKKSKCICLTNYAGRYCENEIDYCKSNPCKEDVPCKPRLGGYNCECPETRTGRQCEIPKRITLKQMKDPNFLFVIQQYSGMLFQYCFYAISVGELPSVAVSFGDETDKTVHEIDFTRLNDVKNRHMKKTFPALNFVNTNPHLVVFKHTYKKVGYYNITVAAYNGQNLVYESLHEVRVDPPSHCELSTKLRNCVKSVGANITEYTREDHIVILSDTIVNCSHAKLSYAWSLHKLNTKFDKHTEENVFHFGPKTANNEPNLNIYPYSLPFGVYAAQLNVTMKKPKADIVQLALTWFQVKELRIVARLTEGSLQQVRWSSPVFLDASQSYNPNEPPKEQKNLVFAWTCAATGPLQEDVAETMDTFCPYSTDTPLLTSGSILSVPPRSLLLNWGYIFALQISEAHGSPKYHNLTEAMASVVIEVVPDDTPIMMVKCVRNCENNEVNPFDTTVLEAVCTTCFNGMDQEVDSLEWRFTSLNGETGLRDISDDETVLIRNDLSTNISTLILDEGIMSGHERFFITLRVIENAKNSTGQSAANNNIRSHIGAERVINIASPPEAGYCNILPQQGYAMLTSFHIFCYNFKDKNLPLHYEAMQFNNFSEKETNFLGTLVGYEIESEIHDLRLAAGMPENDHLTLIRTIVSSKYLYTFYDFNVTVFPVLYYLKSPIQVLNFLSHMVKDETSSLGLMQGTSNVFASTQMIKVTAESAVDLLESDYVRYIDTAELERIIQSVQDSLANYLYEQPVLNLGGLKHYATALDAVLKLPRYRSLSASNVIGGKLLENTLEILDHLKNIYVNINKADVEDLAPRIMSVAANLLRIPSDIRDIKFSARTFGFSNSNGGNNDRAVFEESNLGNQKFFANFTQRVLDSIYAYGRHILPHKANHEKSTLCESHSPDLKFSVQRNSPNSFSKNGLFIQGCVGLVPMFPGDVALDSGLSVYMLYIEENPFWWHPKAREINYPLVQLLMYDNKQNPIKVPTKIMMQNPERMKYKTIHGHLALHPYWTLNDYDIQVNRVQVPKGGKLIVQFMPIIGHHKIQVIVKKGFRPELIDFWKEANVIPQKESLNGTVLVESYSIYVDEESTSDEEFFYVGVLPHIDTLRALSGEDGQKSLFPKMFTNDDDVYEDDDDEAKNKKELKAKVFKPKIMKVREPTNNTLPFEYAAYSIRCIPLNTSAEDLSTNTFCHVRPATTYETVFCKCDDFDMLSASFQSVDADLHMARSVQFYLPFIDNPLTFYLIFFVLVLFFIVLLWAMWLDYDDKLYREIIFLADNDPRHLYFYLVIVQTGRRPCAGTTSNVAIQLVGETANSQVHILKSSHRPVLRRGSQEWFVLKTEASLGNISWINLWHDHLEANPCWYCSKVTVHDIQSNEVWFFFAEQWLAPLYGDGNMSCSVYNTVDTQVFQKRYRFGESFMKGIGDGFHGWFSPFYKHAGNSFTRCQRVIVAFVHLLFMLLIVIHVYHWPRQDDDLSQNSGAWTNRNLYNGVCTALIAFPLHLCLTLVFMCITPKPPWWYTPVYWRQFMKIDMPNEPRSKYERDPLKTTNAQGDKFYTVAYSVGMTKSSIPPENRRSIQPMIGRIAGQEWFCLPHWFKYILWAIIVLFIIISLFFIYFNGVEHSSSTGYSTLVTLVIAILFSMLVLEMAKVIIFAIYNSIVSRKQITVEDRSDLALFLEDEYNVEPRLIPKRLEELERIREEDMYRPIPEHRANLLQRNAMKESSVRSVITDISVFLLFLFLLVIALNGITDSLGYLNVRNVKNLIQGQPGFGRIRLDMISEQEGFINYLNKSLIPNLYEEEHYNGRPINESGYTADFTNRLIGVPRLRQIRLQKDDCKEIFKSKQNWANRCKGDYLYLDEDNADYGPGWKKLEKSKPGYHRVRKPLQGTAGNPGAWIYETWWTSATASSSGVVTTYSGGGYVALLGRTRQASWQSLEYLLSNNWFDNLTTAVFLEFSLYNPNCNLVSVVSILAENTAVGRYEVRSRVDLVKVKPVSNVMPFVVFALFALLVIALVLCVHRDGFRIKTLRRWTYFGNIWYALNIVLAILGLIVAFCLLERTSLLSAATERLREPNVNKYIQFNVLLHWDQFLLAVMAIMLFLVMLQTWHLFSVEYKCHLVMTVLQVATHSLMCYAFIFLILLCAFATVGYLVFVSTTYSFRSVLNSFVSMVGFSHRDFYYDSIHHVSYYSMFPDMIWGKLFFLAFFVLYFSVFRWGFVVILIDKFRRVSRVALQRRWLEPVIVSFMQMNLASVRDFGRRGFLRSDAESLVDDYVRASFRDSLARLRAMELIVANMNERRKLGGVYDFEFIAQSKEIAMAAMVIDHIEAHMQYKRRRNPMPGEKYASTIRQTFTKERKATAMLVTYLKIIALQQKLNQLNEAIEQLLFQYDEYVDV